MDRADMESAPTFVNRLWRNDKFMKLNIVDVLILLAGKARRGCYNVQIYDQAIFFQFYFIWYKNCFALK